MFALCERESEDDDEEYEKKEKNTTKNNAISHFFTCGERQKHAKNMAFTTKTTVMQIR